MSNDLPRQALALRHAASPISGLDSFADGMMPPWEG